MMTTMKDRPTNGRSRRRIELARVVERARPRPASGPRIAFVLSGGGNQGVAQVGMLRALIERSIVPHVVVGTSVGALNGAAIAHSPDLAGVARLARIWTAIDAADVFPGGRFTRAWNVVRRGTHLFPNDGLLRVLDAASPVEQFCDLSVPLRVVATDLDTGEEVVIASGPLRPALLASAAIPGVFPIVEHGGRRLVDGGVVNTVPLWHALSGPVDRVYVLNVSGGGVAERAPRSPLDVVMTSFLHARNMRFEHELRHLPDGVEVVTLPRPFDGRSLLDFSRATELIDEAYQLACAELDRRAPARTERRRLRVLPRRAAADVA
jgi:NTE family protein